MGIIRQWPISPRSVLAWRFRLLRWSGSPNPGFELSENTSTVRSCGCVQSLIGSPDLSRFRSKELSLRRAIESNGDIERGSINSEQSTTAQIRPAFAVHLVIRGAEPIACAVIVNHPVFPWPFSAPRMVNRSPARRSGQIKPEIHYRNR